MHLEDPSELAKLIALAKDPSNEEFLDVHRQEFEKFIKEYPIISGSLKAERYVIYKAYKEWKTTQENKDLLNYDLFRSLLKFFFRSKTTNRKTYILLRKGKWTNLKRNIKGLDKNKNIQD